ncbi:hypothetical protein Trydic_g8193 [Trypoxylus dichotomus]
MGSDPECQKSSKTTSHLSNAREIIYERTQQVKMSKGDKSTRTTTTIDWHLDLLLSTMEFFMIQSRAHLPQATTGKPRSLTNSSLPKATKKPATMTTEDQFDSLSNITANYSLLLEDQNYTQWNNSDVLFNVTNSSYFSVDYDYQTLNASVPTTSEAWTCKEWTPAQHTLFQTANFFFAAAFLVPGSFKQSVLLVRALLTLGYVFLTFWAAIEVCAPDILLWNLLLVILNLTHTLLLTWRFLPPTLTLELTELYLKVFKPLRVSKKHFKELVREAQVVNLEKGDIYAVEDVSPADERLSILLKGKLRVTCDDTHLHFINVHQFVDSPEWEANHDQSDDVFQVTVVAEEDSVFLCWPRMKLERILRHKPMLKIVLDCIIDIVPVTTSFLENYKSKNYKELFENMLTLFHEFSSNICLKIHFLDSHLNLLPDSCSQVSDKHGERFHWDIAKTKQLYQNKRCTSMLAD